MAGGALPFIAAVWSRDGDSCKHQCRLLLLKCVESFMRSVCFGGQIFRAVFFFLVVIGFFVVPYSCTPHPHQPLHSTPKSPPPSSVFPIATLNIHGTFPGSCCKSKAVEKVFRMIHHPPSDQPANLPAANRATNKLYFIR